MFFAFGKLSDCYLQRLLSAAVSFCEARRCLMKHFFSILFLTCHPKSYLCIVPRIQTGSGLSFFSKRKGEMLQSWHCNPTTMQEKLIKNQTISWWVRAAAPKNLYMAHHAKHNIIKSCRASGDASLTFVCVCVCCCCRVKVSQSFEEFGTDAEQQLWWGFGFYLQVGGAARAERGEAGEGGRKTENLCERETTTGTACLQH